MKDFKTYLQEAAMMPPDVASNLTKVKAQLDQIVTYINQAKTDPSMPALPLGFYRTLLQMQTQLDQAVGQIRSQSGEYTHPDHIGFDGNPEDASRRHLARMGGG